MPKMPNDFSEFLREDRRLLVLRLLASQGDYTLNDSLILQGLDRLGHGIALSTLQADLEFLQENVLLQITRLSLDIQRVCLSGEGLEVAKGKLRCSGVRVPNPSEINDD